MEDRVGQGQLSVQIRTRLDRRSALSFLGLLVAIRTKPLRRGVTEFSRSRLSSFTSALGRSQAGQQLTQASARKRS